MSPTVDLEAASALFHALSDPTRLEIARMLAGGERCVCELAEALDVAQSRLSFHLKILKDAGLVSDRREGTWVHYSLNVDTLAEVATQALSLMRTRPVKAIRACC